MKFADLPQHHALLITHPDRETVSTSLWEEISARSPAHVFFNQTVLDIDTARKIISWAQAPYNDERIALISFHTIGIPAQNAMLKILEEPRLGTRFILLTSNASNLLPTVLSRVYRMEQGNEELQEDARAKEFLRTAHASRMKLPFITELLNRTDEEGRRDREALREFILSITDMLARKPNAARYMEETLETASFAADPSSSGKAILEYLSLLLPELK